MIKIVHFVCRLEYGGVESVILNYFRHINSEEFEKHIITQDINVLSCIEQFEKAGFIIHIVPHKRKGIWKNCRAIYSIMKKERFDIVHSHMTLTNFYVHFMAWWLGCKVRISHSHNAYVTTNYIKKSYYRILSLVNLIPATDYFACGHDAAVFMFGSSRLEKVFILNNALDISLFAFKQEERNLLRSKYHLENRYCIGHIGRFSEQKNHHFLVDVIYSLRDKIPNLAVMLIGTGELYPSVKQYVHQLGLDDVFIFVGTTNAPYLYYQAMDLFILPSLYEGLPVVGLEAQLAGLYCLFSNRIDGQIAISDNIELLDINNKSLWSERILDHFATGDKRRFSNIQNIQQLGYDISIEADKLALFYKNRYNQVY